MVRRNLLNDFSIGLLFINAGSDFHLQFVQLIFGLHDYFRTHMPLESAFNPIHASFKQTVQS